MAKTLAEYLYKYTPSAQRYADILASGMIVAPRADKENRMLEIKASFPTIVEKRELYALEDEIKAAYALN